MKLRNQQMAGLCGVNKFNDAFAGNVIMEAVTNARTVFLLNEEIINQLPEAGSVLNSNILFENCLKDKKKCEKGIQDKISELEKNYVCNLLSNEKFFLLNQIAHAKEENKAKLSRAVFLYRTQFLTSVVSFRAWIYAKRNFWFLLSLRTCFQWNTLLRGRKKNKTKPQLE